MQARIKVHGFLKVIVPSRFRHPPVDFEFGSPIPVYRLLTVILGLETTDYTVTVGGKIVNTGYVIQDGDEIHIYPPIAGG